MLNIEEIDKAILELEAHDTTYATVEKLAMLYTVRDHLKPAQVETARTGDLNGNEFLAVCSGVPIAPLLGVISEHMEELKMLYPKSYNAIITRVKSIQK